MCVCVCVCVCLCVCVCVCVPAELCEIVCTVFIIRADACAATLLYFSY